MGTETFLMCVVTRKYAANRRITVVPSEPEPPANMINTGRRRLMQKNGSNKLQYCLPSCPFLLGRLRTTLYIAQVCGSS
jgi:hypothetical protein